MQPRTKQQIKIYALSKALPKITKTQIKWAERNVLSHFGFRTSRVISCMDCGEVFPAIKDVQECKCPACGVNLSIKDSKHRTHDQREFLAILSVVDGYQVNRFFEFRSYHRKGEKVRIDRVEVAVQFMGDTGKMVEIIARNRGGMGWYNDSFSGYLEIKKWNANKYDIYPTAIYPKMEVLPIITRNGFKGDIGNCTPFELFNSIIPDPRAETLLKAGQMGLIGAITSDSKDRVTKYWNSIKICMRNSYIVDDASTWLDYLDLLRYFQKDLNSPKYVCIDNLKAEHNRLVAKKSAILAEERRLAELDRQRKKALDDKKRIKEFLKDKKKFFGMVFSSGNITIKVLESIEEFIAEGDALKHCVFTNEYYAKKESLILSARINGKPIETIELSLTSMKIIQARGAHNEVTPHHNKIIKMVRQNVPTIRKTYQSVKKSNLKAA